jgi:hypothetical protein
LGLKKERDDEDLNEYPQDMKEEHFFLFDWINELAGKYEEKIFIEHIDVRTLRGFYKSIRYWTQTYPTFIVNKKEKYSGRDKSQLDLILQGHLARS